MKYTSFIIFSSIFCITYSFDMKYSIVKHEWRPAALPYIANDTIDNNWTGILWTSRNEKKKVPLKSTDLTGAVFVSHTYILAANFEIYNTIPSCLYSMERKGKLKLALCLEPAGKDALTFTLDSANIPDGKLSFAYKILKNQYTRLILSVTKTGITQIINCKVIEEKRFKTEIFKILYLTDDMDVSVGFPLTAGQNISISIADLDLYSPVDVTTLTTLCPNLNSAQFTRGEKGDRGPKGDSGSKCEAGECGTGPMGIMGPKGDKGDRVQGEKGERGEPGSPAPEGSSCPTIVCSASTDEHEALRSIASGMKLLSDYIIEKTEQINQLAEHISKSNERFANVQQNMINMNNDIKDLKNALLTESQL